MYAHAAITFSYMYCSVFYRKTDVIEFKCGVSINYCIAN